MEKQGTVATVEAEITEVMSSTIVAYLLTSPVAQLFPSGAIL